MGFPRLTHQAIERLARFSARVAAREINSHQKVSLLLLTNLCLLMGAHVLPRMDNRYPAAWSCWHLPCGLSAWDNS
jgi:hypothetical protein